MKRVQTADLDEDWGELLDAARRAREAAYIPYSHFAVGAAVRAVSGRIHTGANVENAAYGLTVCAERVAIWKAVSEGERVLTALALVTGTGSTPCGSCRQVMAEFAPGLPVLIADAGGRAWMTTLPELLPYSFTGQDLDRAQ